MRLNGTCDDIAMWIGFGLLFGEFAYCHQIIYKRMVARLKYDPLLWAHLIHTTIANMGNQYTIRTQGKKGKRCTHFSYRIGFIQQIQLLIGFLQRLFEGILHFRSGAERLLRSQTPHGFRYACTGHFTVFVSAHAIANHKDPCIGCRISFEWKKGVFLIFFFANCSIAAWRSNSNSHDDG